MERIALQDAERERERVLKEAEEKLKELELNKQLNETQVKKPIEDVINSDKPIQLTNAKAPTSSIGETTPVTSNYDPPKYDATGAASAYPFYYVNATSSNPAASFNYNASVASATAQEPSVSFSARTNISTQSIQPNRSSIQSNLVSTSSLAAQPTQTSQSPNTAQHTCLPQPNLQQTTLSQNSTLPTNLPNYYSAAANHNLARNQSTNLPPNQTTVPLSQLTKAHHPDTGLPQSGLHQHPATTTLYNVNPAASQLYSQSHHHQLQTSLPNYNAYLNSPTNRTNYSTTTNTTASIRGVYNNAAVSFHAYPPTNQMPHLNHSLPSNSPVNSLNNKATSNNLAGQPSNVASIAQGGTPAAYSSTSYTTTTNYVPSTYTNGILLPQQQQIASKSSQVDDKKPIAATNKPANDSVGSSVANDTGGSPSNAQAANLPFASRPNGRKIDVTDFENSSSPFDDALLRSIDDKEELNNIFQQFYNGAK